MPKLGLGASLGRTGLVQPGVITTGRTTWAPFDSPGQTGTAYTGQALEFDGVSDEITLGTPVCGGNTEMTLTAWFQKDVGSTGAIAGWTTGGTYIRFSSATNLLIYFDGVDANFSFNTTFSDDGNWHHLVITYNGATGSKFYLDGSLTSPTVAGANDVVTGSLDSDSGRIARIGNYGAVGTTLFSGKMANVQIWDKEWSADDVTYAYSNPESLVNLPYENLKVWYPMQSGHRGNQSHLLDGANTGLGDEIITSDMSWNLTSTGANWSQNGTAFTSDGSANGRAYVAGAGSIVVGNTYKISYDITAYTSGAVRVELGTSNSAGAEENSGIGSYSTYFTAKTNTNIYVNQGSLAFVGTFDNLSILPVNAKNHGTSVFYGDELVANGDSDSTLPTINGQNLAKYDAASFAISTAITGSTETYNGSAAGDDSILVTADSSSTYPLIRFLDGTDCGLVTGRTYYISCYVYIPASQTLDTVTLQALDNGGSTISLGGAGSTTTTNTWVKLYGSYVSDDPQRCFEVRGSGGDVSNELFYVDQISIKEVGFATGWTEADAQPTIPQLGFQSYNQMGWFDGTTPTVSFASPSELDNLWDSPGGSVSFWVFIPTDTATTIIGKQWYISRLGSGKLRFYLHFDGDDLYMDSSIDLPYEEWVHVTVTVNAAAGNNDAAFYINGVLIDNTNSQDGVSDRTTDGGSNFTIPASFNGFITEMSIFNGVLTLSEVQELYNDGEALDATLHSSAPNLSGYWRNEGAATWTDLSTNSNNGTATSISENLILPEGNNGRDTQGFLMTRERTSGLNLTYKNDGGQRVSYVDIGAQTISSGTDFTIGFWAKPVASYNANNIMGASGNDYMYFSATGNDVRLYIRANGNSAYEEFDSDDVHNTNDLEKWQYWTITRGELASNQLRFYLNGRINNTGANITTHAFAHDMDLRYLANITSSSTPFRGVLDDMVIYNSTALTPAQVLRNYKAGKRRHKN